MILHTLHHCLFGSFIQNLLLNRQSFILTTNAMMQVLTLRYLYIRLQLSCDFFAPVSSSAHYLLQLFPRSDFFLLGNEWVLKCSEVQYFTQNILK